MNEVEIVNHEKDRNVKFLIWVFRKKSSSHIIILCMYDLLVIIIKHACYGDINTNQL